MFKIKNKFAIGCLVQWYEIEIVGEYIDSLIQVLNEVENKQDIIVDFIGGNYLSQNINAAATDAVLVNLAMLGGRYGDTFDFSKVLA